MILTIMYNINFQLLLSELPLIICYNIDIKALVNILLNIKIFIKM